MFSTYKFLVGRQIPWDPDKKQILYIVDDPVQAYAIYYNAKAGDKNTAEQVLWEWYLHDSFDKDALRFCKEKYDGAEDLSRIKDI